MAGQPNILLIVTDQHALHAVSSYGAPICRTPHIDSLAAGGVRFDRAYTCCALCTPARASLLTGLYPHNHGALHNTGIHLRFDETQTGQGLEMYPRRLAAEGYQLGYAGKWHAGVAATGADVGFEGVAPQDYGTVRDLPEYRQYLRDSGFADLPRLVTEWCPHEQEPQLQHGNVSGYMDAPAVASPDFFLADCSQKLIERYSRTGRPWMVACNFWGPHSPYWPALEYKDLYDPRGIPPWPSFHDDLAGRPLIHKKVRHSVFARAEGSDWPTWAQVIARYYGQATQIDAAIGRLLTALKRMGLYDDTLIVFTSDHGETAGIHGGMFDKEAMAYEEVYHIPMIVKMPGARHAGATRRQLVSLLDVTPTICQAAGTSMPQCDGRSLLPLIGDANAPGREHLLAEFHGHRFPVSMRVLWWRQYKFVLNFADVDELYDLQADPAEMTNLIDSPHHQAIADEMRRRMLQELQASGDRLGPQWQYFLTRPLRGLKTRFEI